MVESRGSHAWGLLYRTEVEYALDQFTLGADSHLPTLPSMYRTSTRPVPLEFVDPSSYPYSDGAGKDLASSTYPPARHTQGDWEPPKGDGLRTPPAENMATTYTRSPYNGDPTRQDASNPRAEGTSSGRYMGSNGYQASAVHPPCSRSSSRPPAPASALILQDVFTSRSNCNQVSSPQSANRLQPLAIDEEHGDGVSGCDAVVPSLHTPPSVNNRGGSLAGFAAQITCLFWFESAETLHKAEALSATSSPIRRLRRAAVPSVGFAKWVVTVLSTTQVTQNVILLALLFIYRLKAFNPAVKGRSGSEYRLLTVALMLGNKFLDDNTYTNKTWAEVSGISVTEIHVMEVEFLSNMRYSLLASSEEWQAWHEKLGKFWDYCDQASRTPCTMLSPLRASTGSPALPSPPVSMQASPPSLPNPYFMTSSSPYPSSQQWFATNGAPPLHSPTTSGHEHGMLTRRKRSVPIEGDEPPPKRPSRSTPMGPMSYTSAPRPRRDAPRLPVPNLTISTSQPMNHSYTNNNLLSQHAPGLPPLTGRAMSGAYPASPTRAPPHPMLTPTGPMSHHRSSGAGAYNTTHGTPSHRQSPHSLHDLLFNSSPISSTLPSQGMGHVSPSYFLQQRASPYRPVRNVTTLLYPPPTASMGDYSTTSHQMHYQPLGKRDVFRSGVVPEYVPNPYQQPWPILPQPQPQPHFNP